MLIIGFDAIGDSNFTSDVGWGCMLRSSQMLVAQVFCFISLHPTLPEDDFIIVVASLRLGNICSVMMFWLGILSFSGL